jgi:hypothetical protein
VASYLLGVPSRYLYQRPRTQPWTAHQDGSVEQQTWKDAKDVPEHN